MFDIPQTELLDALEKFIATVQPGDFVMIYFSGFGYQIGKVNYLLPVNFDPKSDSAPGERALSVRKLQELDDKNPATKLLIFDAERSCAEAAKTDPGKSCRTWGMASARCRKPMTP